MTSDSGERPASFESIEGAIAAIGDKTPMGDAFERAVLHYLRHDPVVGFEQAWLWDDWPERIGLGLDRDQGVDIVAIDGEGKRVAVQVKFHSDPERNVGQREVATLFGFRSDLFDRWSRQRGQEAPRCPRGQHDRLERCAPARSAPEDRAGQERRPSQRACTRADRELLVGDLSAAHSRSKGSAGYRPYHLAYHLAGVTGWYVATR